MPKVKVEKLKDGTEIATIVKEEETKSPDKGKK
jgi:hypothetical protein